jgi:nucleoside-diphosphate-sugar epimerase
LRILLTGADGFTGHRFIQTAAAAGHETVALRADRRRRAPSHRKSQRCRQTPSFTWLERVVVIRRTRFYDVNLFGTLNLLDAPKLADGHCRRSASQ